MTKNSWFYWSFVGTSIGICIAICMGVVMNHVQDTYFDNAYYADGTPMEKVNANIGPKAGVTYPLLLEYDRKFETLDAVPNVDNGSTESCRIPGNAKSYVYARTVKESESHWRVIISYDGKFTPFPGWKSWIAAHGDIRDWDDMRPCPEGISIIMSRWDLETVNHKAIWREERIAKENKIAKELGKTYPAESGE